MKTIYTYLKGVVLAGCLLAGVATPTYAQWDASKAHLIVDWQMNAPFSTGYADKISGWGMNFELGYELTPRWEVGVFASYHTNHQYVGRQTLSLSPTESLTTDQQRSAFQVPFGVMGAYNLSTNRYVKPYVGVKAGTMFARNTIYFGSNGVYDKSWGFYVSPEIGVKIYPTGKKWGFHVAGYYSYATNKTQTLTFDVEGQNQAGFRLGVIF